jgi:hypothetical protein
MNVYGSRDKQEMRGEGKGCSGVKGMEVHWIYTCEDSVMKTTKHWEREEEE